MDDMIINSGSGSLQDLNLKFDIGFLKEATDNTFKFLRTSWHEPRRRRA